MRFMLGTMAALAMAGAAPAEDWSGWARQDVLAAYDSYVANHPGTHDPANPAFRDRLNRARDEALKVAQSASDRSGYVEALGVFSAEIQDGHALAFAKPLPGAAPLPREWPGFVAAWRGKGMVVHHAGSASPAPAGTPILSCDGRPVAELVTLRLRTRGLRAAEAGHWWARSQQAFTSSPVFKRNRPERCLFQTSEGPKEAALAWSPAPADFDTLLRTASDGERTPIITDDTWQL